MKNNKDTNVTFISVTNRLIVIYLSLRKRGFLKKTYVTPNDLRGQTSFYKKNRLLLLAFIQSFDHISNKIEKVDL